MTLNDIYQQFEACKSWEERYRLLIQLSKSLDKPSEQDLQQWQEIDGCESRLWFDFTLQPRIVNAFSDARLMQGILVVLKTALQELNEAELAQLDLIALFDQLKITAHLSQTRLNGLKEIEKIVKESL